LNFLITVKRGDFGPSKKQYLKLLEIKITGVSWLVIF